jgi:AmmeMemoRadiSam system protein B
MDGVRGPVVAGSFYPADPRVLRTSVRRMLDAARTAHVVGDLRALIVPHAGYIYSGPIAATAYALLEGMDLDRIVLIGPSHFAWFAGLAVPDASAWATPLGSVPIVSPAPGEVAGVSTVPEAFAAEHCLEVQIPFLQETLGSFTVTLFLTGDVGGRVAADALESLVDELTLLIVSSDLSHYHEYTKAVRLDGATAAAITGLRPADLGPESACGRVGVQAVLHLAERRQWRAHLLDLRNSGDTAGGQDRVVGYGAFAFA